MNEKGQSMVEMAVIAPLLVFIFIGLIEVGWAIRGYMIILQASREAARYAVRGDVARFWPVAGALNEEEATLEEQGYQAVFAHFLVAGGPESATAIIHRYRAYTGRTCEILPCDEDCSSSFRDDDQAGYWIRQQGDLRESRINDEQELSRLLETNFLLNCKKELRYWEMCLNWPEATEETCQEKIKSVNTDYAADSILVEVFFDQPQITGFYWFADPIPLWAYTIMRIASDARPL